MAPNIQSAEGLKCLALFDFDGTITARDSFFEFIRFSVGTPHILAGIFLLSPVLAGYKLGLLANGRAKEIISRFFFANRDRRKFISMAQEFSVVILPGLIKDSAIKRLLWHRDQGHEVVIVSASFEVYLRAWCEGYGFKLIATRLEEDQDRITGKFEQPNCQGSEKVRRIEEMYRLNQFDVIFAYGDSDGDKEMLKLGTHAYYQYFS